MSNKNNHQSNSLDSIKFVQNIDPQTAANYSGGAGRINDGNNDPDIILYEDANQQGQSIGINASIGDGIDNLANEIGEFNDKTSSIKILRGQWRFFDDAGSSEGSPVFGPGSFDTLPAESNDILTSVQRVG